MKLNKTASYVFTGIGILAVITAFLFIFLTILYATLFIGSIIMIAGVATMLFAQLTEDSDQKKSKPNETPKDTMSQEERIEKLKQMFLEGDISEEEFEKRIDKELDRQKNREVQFSREKNNIF